VGELDREQITNSVVESHRYYLCLFVKRVDFP